MVTLPLTHTKILVPRRPPNLLTRERLLNLLYDLLDHRLIIIAAPAGYGKTSLLIDLAHHNVMPVCWYALDELDRSPERFVAHFIGAIAQRFPGFGKQSAAALHDMSSSDFDRLAGVIVNDVYEHIQEHFALVLDDYHLISDCELVNRFISKFIQQVDENCHLLISSRTLLNLLDLPLMIARSQVGGLAFGELAFRAEEIQVLLLQNYHLTIPTSEAEKLVQATEGWITGLLLSAETMWQGMADRVRVARVSGIGLYDYLAQQVLDQQTPPLRDFLLRTSLMEEFDAGLCEAVLGPGADWPRMMRAVLRSNLFVLPVGEEGTWLRYHHLFREFLQAQLTREHPREKTPLLRRLMAAYMERQEWEKAHAVCLRLDDAAAMAALIEQAGMPLAKGGRWITLANWIDALPVDTLEACPDLLSLRGSAAVELGDVRRGLSLLDQAEAALQAAGNWSQLAHTLVRRATYRRLVGDYHASLTDVEQVLAFTERDENLREVEAEALRAKGGNLFRLGRLNDAIEWLGQSLKAYVQLGDKQNEALLLMELGLAHVSAGRHNQAWTYYNRALDYWQKTENLLRQSNLLNNMGVLCHLNGDYESARTFLHRALDGARRAGFPRVEALALSSLGDLYTDLEVPTAALDAYRQARDQARRIDYRFLLFYLDVAEAGVYRSKGEIPQAHVLLESARHAARKSGSTYEQGLWRLEAGRLALAERNPSRAVAHFEKAAGCFDGSFRVEAVMVHFYWAMAHQGSQGKKAALACLGRAFVLASDLENQHPLVLAGRESKPLLQTAQSDPTVGASASVLLRQVIQFEENIPEVRRRLRQQGAAVPLAPPRLSFRALGPIQVMIGDRCVTGADWEARVARDLVFCLLAHPGGLTREEIGAIFWPEHTPAQLGLQFKKTIYRLRRAIGQDVVSLVQDRYLFNRTLDYEYDVEVFEGHLAQARAAGHTSESTASYQAAIDRYKGPFLPDVDGTWIHAERERLWQAYVEAVLTLSECCYEAGDFPRALELVHRILMQDGCVEEAVRLALRAYAAMGNRADMARQLARSRQALLKEADAPLSPQTEMLYESLMAR